MNGLVVKSELSSEMAFIALSISINTRTESDRVEAFTLPTVKYVHGFVEKSIPPKFEGEKSDFGHDGHSPQCES